MIEGQTFWRLAFPLAAQQVGFQLMGTVDAALLGHYSDTSLAASGVGNNLLFAISSIGLGVVLGLDTVIPQAIGGGRLADARRYLAGGLRLAVLVGIACSLVVFASPLVLGLADVPADVAAEARTYVYLRALGIVPFLLSVALRSYLAARDVTRPLLVAVIVGNIANAVLDLALIFGIEAIGLPPLGVFGAGLATLTVQLVIVVVYFASVRALDDHAPRPRPTRADIATIARYGGPIGGQLFAEVGIFGVATVLAAHLGTRSAAAHAIALNLSSFTFAVAVGLGSATSVRVGHAVGTGDLPLARQRGLQGIAIGFGAMAMFALAFLVLPQPIAHLFTDDPAVIGAIVPLLQIVALFQLSDGAQAIGAGALRGLGDTRSTLVANLVGHYGVGLPISLVLTFTIGMGAPGLWWGLSAGLTVTAGYVVVRFLFVTR
ncbi:MAG: Multi antimicrobial extrusion protein [Deltaproteobacteria bacterium]|nr:Multi antimicrobial extrusion protein [Deltaproteobacteria bacterium]